MEHIIKQKISGTIKIWGHGNILCLTFLFFMSCVNHRLENTNGLAYYTITNESLIEEIVKYRKEVKTFPNTDKIVHVNVSHSDDTVTYQIFYSVSAFGVIHTPATVFARINENTIAVTFGADYDLNEFILPDSIAWLYLKSVFKNEYEYYKEYNWYPAPTTGMDVLWILQYKGGALINKKRITWKISEYEN